MVQGDLGDHRGGHAVVMACSSLTSVAVKMAADLERMPLRIAELEIPDHEFDEYVGGVKRYRPAASLEEVALRTQGVGFLALRRHHGYLPVVSLEMLSNFEQKIDTTADVEELAFTLLTAPLRQ